MAKISEMSLTELYERRITSSVEREILLKEGFLTKSDRWCEKVCKLACKNPPNPIFFTEQVDVLVIQDFSAFDEPRFRKRGADIERKHREIISHIAQKTLGKREADGTITRYSHAVTNLLKCSLQQGDIKKGKAPVDTILARCRPYVLKEIEIRKPKVIISLNTVVTKALGFKKSNTNDCGDILDYKGIPVVVTLHPRVLLMLRQNASGKNWGPDFYSMILQDFQKAAGLIDGRLRIPNLDEAIERAKTHIQVAETLEQVEGMCNDVFNAGTAKGVVSFDIETTGLDPWAPDARILCVQFGFRSNIGKHITSLVIPLWHRENKAYDPDLAWKYVEEILLNESIKKTGHNVKFDLLYTEINKGIRVKGILFDTMLLLHAINSGLQDNYGLKQACSNWLPELELGGYESKLPKLSKRGEKDGDGTTGDGEEPQEGNDSEAEESEGTGTED